MNRLFLSLLFLTISLFIFAGCTKVGEGLYNEGTYYAYDEETGYSVVVYVDNTGSIASVFFDAVYAANCAQRGVLDNTCTITTKQALGDDYNMRVASPINSEWYEQVNTFAAKVVTEQNLDWLEFKYRERGADDKYTFTTVQPEGQEEDDKVFTDSVAGVTIIVDNLSRLVNNALNLASE